MSSNPPSLLPQWESRGPFVHYARHYYEKAIFILTGGFNHAIRHSRRSGNPEPWSCAKTVMPAWTRRVDRTTSHLDHSCIFAQGWIGERVLDSRCGENDGRRGQLKYPVEHCPKSGGHAGGHDRDKAKCRRHQEKTRRATATVAPADFFFATNSRPFPDASRAAGSATPATPTRRCGAGDRVGAEPGIVLPAI